MTLDIRFCRLDEAEKIQSFILQHIRTNEPLGLSRRFFDFFYLNALRQRYNLLLAINGESDELLGFYGTIPTYKFDPLLERHQDIWASGFVVRADQRGNGIGKHLLAFHDEQIEKGSDGALGISNQAFPIFIARGYTTGFLNHYYLLGNGPTFRIADKLPDPSPGASRRQNTIIPMEVLDLKSVSVPTVEGRRPQKTVAYAIERYQKHPIFQYRFFVVAPANGGSALYVIRKIHVNGSSCLRIVDIIGDFRSLESANLAALVNAEGAEYIDCLNFGVDESLFSAAGFSIRSGDTIIPDHFDPFERKTIPINFAFKGTDAYVMFKGDGSIDRPATVTEIRS